MSDEPFSYSIRAVSEVLTHFYELAVDSYILICHAFSTLIAGDVTCLATVPSDMEVEAYFIAKEDGVIAGIALAEMIFSEVDPLIKVCPIGRSYVLLIVTLPFHY